MCTMYFVEQAADAVLLQTSSREVMSSILDRNTLLSLVLPGKRQDLAPIISTTTAF
jgi:hypothetical protein